MTEAWQIGRTSLVVTQGDITLETTDAIVNAANESLLGGGGVDGTIHRAGGPAILEACRKLGGCATGNAKLTTGGNLQARYVIHTVGPVYIDGQHDEAKDLASCYTRSLEIAMAHEIRTLSFPAISCGVYGYPVEEAADIAVGTVARFVEEHQAFDSVRFILFGPEAEAAYLKALMEFKAYHP